MARKTPEQRLEAAKQAKAKAETDIRKAAAIIREKDRRDDTRRKIILGGAVLARAAEDPAWAAAVRKVLKGLPERDRAPFEGWTPPAPPVAPVQPEPPAVLEIK